MLYPFNIFTFINNLNNFETPLQRFRITYPKTNFMAADKRGKSEIWNKIAGPPGELTMENRAFNYISAISIVLLLSCLAFDIYCGLLAMSVTLIVFIVILAITYYYSRIHKKYKISVVILGIASYITLALNYFTNSGINGPTFFLFFVTLNFFLAITEKKFGALWVSMHLLIGLGLLYCEFSHPEWIKGSYDTNTTRFADIAWTYLVSLAFLFAVTHYLRDYFINARTKAEKSALAIAEQNQRIMEQNILLEKISSDKNKLFSIISHDLRSPLDSIRGYLELMSENILDEEEHAHVRQELLIQTNHTSELLHNLLIWSKQQMNGISVNLKPFDLLEIITLNIDSNQSRAKKKHIHLVNNCNTPTKVHADKEMMKIVIRNLVVNAIKFTNPNGKISIDVFKQEEFAIIAIRDTGVGISNEVKDLLFSTKTTSTAGTENEKGIGLGLRLCKDLVDYQAGKIWFESEPGRGSTFYISLPVAA